MDKYKPNRREILALTAMSLPVATAANGNLPQDTAFTQSFDARDWAKGFVAHTKNNPPIAQDEGAMQGWFSNALMRGWDERGREFDKIADEEGKRRLDCLAEQGIRGAVARGWCSDSNRSKVMDADLAEAIVRELMDLG